MNERKYYERKKNTKVSKKEKPKGNQQKHK